MAELLTRADRLAAFLRAELVKPFRWGETDCALFVADWVRSESSDLVGDPAWAYRGQYDDQAGANELIDGNLEAAVGACAAFADMIRDDMTQDIGAIGVIRLPREGDTCAIRTSIGWAMRGERLLVTIEAARLEVLAAWRFRGADG